MTDQPGAGTPIPTAISSLWDGKFERGPFQYFRDQVVRAIRALLPGKAEEVILETAQVWWERLVTSQALDRNQEVDADLEQEIVYRVIIIWSMRDQSRAVGVLPGPDERLSIPRGLFGD